MGRAAVVTCDTPTWLQCSRNGCRDWLYDGEHLGVWALFRPRPAPGGPGLGSRPQPRSMCIDGQPDRASSGDASVLWNSPALASGTGSFLDFATPVGSCPADGGRVAPEKLRTCRQPGGICFCREAAWDLVCGADASGRLGCKMSPVAQEESCGRIWFKTAAKSKTPPGAQT